METVQVQFIQLTHSLKGARFGDATLEPPLVFQPSNLTCELAWFQYFAFKWVNVCRYVAAAKDQGQGEERGASEMDGENDAESAEEETDDESDAGNDSPAAAEGEAEVEVEVRGEAEVEGDAEGEGEGERGEGGSAGMPLLEPAEKEEKEAVGEEGETETAVDTDEGLAKVVAAGVAESVEKTGDVEGATTAAAATEETEEPNDVVAEETAAFLGSSDFRDGFVSGGASRLGL